MDIQQLIAFDKELLLTLNGSQSLFLDGVFWTATSTVTWIPLGAMLLYILFKNNGPWKGLLTVVAVALVVLLADQLSSGLCKPFFERLRPTQDNDIMYLVDVVNGYRGGSYGFVSSHAANTCALFLFLAFEVRNTLFTVLNAVWVFLNIYSRIYLGVHYPGDILCGALLGCAVGYVVYWLQARIKRQCFNPPSYISTQYTTGGYSVPDLSLYTTVFLFTLFYILLMGILTPYRLAF